MSSVSFIPSTATLFAAKHIQCNIRHGILSVNFPDLPRRAAVKVALPRIAAVSSSAEEVKDGEAEYQVLFSMRSIYNHIIILDYPDSRLLLLDSTTNIHSIYNKGNKWTCSYWDQFATLPAIVPEGPIAILGLGGGTAAHLLLEVQPSLQLHGWEIDGILIDIARDYLGLSDLEKHTEAGGILHVHVGDALSSSASVPGGFAGIIVDLFCDGKVLPQLEEVETWLALREKLMPNGRIMVNCASDGLSNTVNLSINHIWESNSTIKALCRAFPNELSWMKLSKAEGENCLALTGPLPDLDLWTDALPDQLSSSVKQWSTCTPC